MASGIVKGLLKMLSLTSKVPNGLIISVCDQPFVSAKLFHQLREMKYKTGKGIIACGYADTTGTPVLFANKYFESLLQLKGKEGAKKLLKIYEADVAIISFPEGTIDIDTEEDYKKLIEYE